MDSARNSTSSDRLLGANAPAAHPPGRPLKRRDLRASPRPISVEIGTGKRSEGPRKSREPNSEEDTTTDESPAPPPESSAYALLALMASVQQATQQCTDERGRTSEPPSILQARARGDNTKKRKPTHTVRKEEISMLNDEIAQLEKRLAFLRGQTLTSTRATTSSGPAHQEEDPEHPFIPNALLREAIHEQQLSLACARSMVSRFITSDHSVPVHCYLHLTSSPRDRLRTLQAMKPQQLRIARRYVLERSRHLDITKPHAAGEQFVNESGDACSVRFLVEQFPARVSVRKVFEAAIFYTSNLEISFTDGAGRITIREDNDEIEDPTMSHHRTLSTIPPNLRIEGSVAVFTHFDEDGDFGITTSTYVDRDDLHPYRPQERIRQDVTAALLVSREKDCVVLRRLNHVRIHRNDHLPLSVELAMSLSEGVSRWGDALVDHARQNCGLDKPKLC